MLYEQFKRLMHSVPALPNSLRQSFDNPVQADRLPQATGLVTEFPVFVESTESAKRIVRRTALVAIFACLFRALLGLLPYPYSHDAYGLFASISVCSLVAAWIGWPKDVWQLGAYIVVLPALVAYILYLRSLFALLLIATVCTVIVADRFAKHTLYLGSTTPYPREQSQSIRRKWATRFWHLKSVRGLELYWLVIVLLLATPWFIDGIATAIHPFGNRFILPAAFATLTFLFLLPVAVELLAALLYSRPTMRIANAKAAFSRSLLDWHCYNSKEIKAAGILQSPVGKATSRKRMLIAVVLLWCCAFEPLFSTHYTLYDQLEIQRESVYLRQQNPETEVEEELPQQPFDRRTIDQLGKDNVRENNELRAWTGDLEKQPPQVAKLQPYQLRILTQLPQEQRNEFLRKAVGLPSEKAFEEIGPKLSTRSNRGYFERIPNFKLLSEIDDPPSQREIMFGRNGRSRHMFAYVTAIGFLVGREAIVLLLSFSFPLVFLYATGVRLAACLRMQLEARPDTILAFGNWNRLVDDIAQSRDQIERASLLLGTNKADGSPIIVPRIIFEEHAHILGDSGSGKTSMGVALILNQLIRQKDCSIVVIDLKGDDKALFRGTQIDAANANKRFRWFTNELHKSSYGFNPLAQEYFRSLSLYQKTDVITAALGLQYGTDYGRGHYSDANANYLHRTLQQFPNIGSFQKLAQPLQNPTPGRFSREDIKDASHLVSIVKRLASTESLNLTSDSNCSAAVLENQIDFADIFREPQVVYFHLPSSKGATSAAEIARVALYSIIGSASETPERDRKQVFVFVDEFQRIIANNLDMILQTARSMNIGLILANQSLTDLKRQGVDLMSTIRTNTRFKQVFAASNIEDMREIVELSGEALVHSRSFTDELSLLGTAIGSTLKINNSESTSPRLRVNDVLLASDAPDQSIVQIRRGDGYAQYGGFPFVMRSQFHISPDEYRERKSFPWPPVDEQTIAGREVVEVSSLSQFDQVHPIADRKPVVAEPSSEVEGLDQLLESSNALLEKRERRRRQKSDQQPEEPPS